MYYAEEYVPTYTITGLGRSRSAKDFETRGKGGAAQWPISLILCTCICVYNTTSGESSMPRVHNTLQFLRAEDMMTRHPVTIDLTGTVQDAADLMYGAEVRHLPVVTQHTLVGIFTIHYPTIPTIFGIGDHHPSPSPAPRPTRHLGPGPTGG